MNDHVNDHLFEVKRDAVEPVGFYPWLKLPEMWNGKMWAGWKKEMSSVSKAGVAIEGKRASK
jgi:hypothetical protein